MRPRTHDITDSESQAIFGQLEADALAERIGQQRIKRHIQDLAAAYMGAERIAAAEQIAGRR